MAVELTWYWRSLSSSDPIDDAVWEYVSSMPQAWVFIDIVATGLKIRFAKEEDALAFKLRFGCDTSFVR